MFICVLCRITRILVDPARGYCYRCLIKPCELNVFCKHSVMLSNTWITCPQIWHNLGKLRIIPNSSLLLECIKNKRFISSEDGSATYQVVEGVMYLLADDGYGLWKQEPGDGFWDMNPGPTGRSRRENFTMQETVIRGHRVLTSYVGCLYT